MAFRYVTASDNAAAAVYQFARLCVISVLVSSRPAQVAVSYLGMKTGPCTKLRKVLVTHLYAKVGGEFDSCLQSVKRQPRRQFSVQTFE